MYKEPSGSKRKRKNRLVLFFSFVIAGLILGGCATDKSAKSPQALSKPAAIEGIKVRSFNGLVTLVEVRNTSPTTYTAFKLIDPPRVVLDINAPASETLPPTKAVLDDNISEIRIEKTKDPGKARVIIGLKKDLEYKITEENNIITVSFTPKKTDQIQVASTSEAKEEQIPAQETKTTPSEPRIFFKPKPTPLNQVLGVDFTMLDHGKSRVTITTDKKVVFHLERRDSDELVLILENAIIPKLLQRHIDSSEFEGAVEKIKAKYSEDEKEVSLIIKLREMVPFHIMHTEKQIKVDFGPTAIKPPEKKIYPLAFATKTAKEASPRLGVTRGHNSKKELKKSNSGKSLRKYTGAPMTMDFVNADVTNVLRLIGEVSNLNIVWGPEVKGTVSMRLKNVPWDQALDLILANNDLAMRREGNVIWVTTRAHMAKIEQEERKKKEDLEKRRQEQEKRAQELKKLEPIETQYITINYVDVENIKNIIESTVKSETGKITIDKETKTIIMTDTVSKLREAKEVAARLDKPTKQVMIEARIVEASTSFSRNLGIQWSAEMQRRRNTNTSWTGTPAWAPNNVESNYPNGGNLFNPTFSTNHPNFASNLGLVFTTLSGSGLTGAFINTQIALSETEGELKVLSSPKIVTRDTVTATIQQGTKIVLPSGTDSNGNKTFELVDASLKLEVTPHITPNNMVVLDVSISDDFPDYANARGESVPINTKSASTTMMVASGDTVIIGGIYKENKGVNTTGQPWLKDIPIIGWLFKTKSWNDTRTELLIFLTPTVLPSG